jgi:hypothetical protein
MYELDKAYIEQLEILAGEIQESEDLSIYLEEEEEEHYLRLKEAFEPRIAEIQELVAARHPLQLIALELILLDPLFEGLFLPKILGYSVLRGEIDEQYKYVRPQDHFKEVLLAICNSSNFDILKKRIGQSIQIGFALSSDIWVTNLINSIENKRVRYYLQSQKLERYRQLNERAIGYERYKRQFKNDNYHYAEFPQTDAELKLMFNPLLHFLFYRINYQEDNSSIVPNIHDMVANDAFLGAPEHLKVLVLYALFFEVDEAEKKFLANRFNAVRKKMPEYEWHFFRFLMELHQSEETDVTPEADLRISGVLDKSVKDGLSEYYKLLDLVHTEGYHTEEAQEAVKAFYNRHEGLSTINQCLRRTILRYLSAFIGSLEVEAYPELFEIAKLYPVYMNIFANQQFNQNIKDLSMEYLAKLLKHFTDKRGKDYQDIKKFISTTFLDLGFLKEKEIVELFKTRRKKKKTA